jgi:hypothetical protein
MIRRGKNVRVSLIATAVLAVSGVLTTACGQPGNVTPPTPVHAAAHVRPVKFLGVYEPGVPQSYKEVEHFAAAAGRQPNLVLYYSGWYENFKASFARKAHRHGARLLIDINPYGASLASIAAGDYDEFLRSYAAAVRRYGHPVAIGFGREMNGKWYPWGYQHTPASVWIQAWRHIVTVFRQSGAKNVTWIWIINRITTGEGPIRAWWPGAKYVDWVGIDGYYEQPTDTFTSLFDPTIDAVRKFTGKPIIISETAAGPAAGQAAKIPSLFSGIRRRHLLGALWFDKAQHAGLHHQDWRLEGHPAAIAAFRQALRG